MRSLLEVVGHDTGLDDSTAVFAVDDIVAGNAGDQLHGGGAGGVGGEERFGEGGVGLDLLDFGFELGEGEEVLFFEVAADVVCFACGLRTRWSVCCW